MSAERFQTQGHTHFGHHVLARCSKCQNFKGTTHENILRAHLRSPVALYMVTYSCEGNDYNCNSSKSKT
eukprot:2066094-Amphidinium_carterae.1